MFFQLRARRRGSNRLAILLLAGAAVCFLFCCSGLHFPIWDGQGRLQKHLGEDLGVSLPAGSTVTHAISVAYRDPGEYYQVELPQAAVGPFIAAMRAAGRDSKDVDPSWKWTMGRAPAWWTPQNIPQVQRLDIFHRDEQGGYMCYYSPTSSTVYIFWFRT
jgi:hypothetical protein